MSDFELTRLAYKAAFGGAELRDDKDMLRHWSPLTDDGDALRLAVKLGIGLSTDTTYVDSIAADYVANEVGMVTEEPIGDDPYAATRRAVVRAAAEIGKGMK